MSDTFYFENGVTGEIVAAKRGQTGYYETTVYTVEHAEALNQLNGHSPEEVKAAEICSMLGGWEHFESRVALFAATPARESDS